jgi:hypothetical protein
MDKYYGGKRNNSFWREWTIERSLIAGSLSYLLLRDVSILLNSSPLETSMLDAGLCFGCSENIALPSGHPSSSGLEKT